MTICPKCGCSNIQGPRYVKAFFDEHLRYTCARCGYERKEPTRDAAHDRAIDAIKALGGKK